MPTFLIIIQVVSQLMPLVSGLVQSVEATFPNTPGSGKLNAVQSLLQSAFSELGSIGVTFEQVWPTLSAFVNAAVAIYNASGLFKHASSAINTTVTEVNEAGNTLAGAVAASVPVTVVGGSPSLLPENNLQGQTIPAPGAGAGPFAQAASGLTSAAPLTASETVSG